MPNQKLSMQQMARPQFILPVTLTLIGLLFLMLRWFLALPQRGGPSHPELRVSYNAYPGSLAPLLAELLGYYQESSCSIRLIRTDNHSEAMARFSVGTYDGIATTLGSVIANSRFPSAKVVYVKDESRGADVLLAAPEIGNLSQLRGKKVGVVLGDFSEVWLEKLFTPLGMTLADVQLQYSSGDQAPFAIAQAKVAASHSWSPYKEQGIQMGQKVLASSADSPFLIVDVVAFQSQVLETNPTCVADFLRGWSQAVDYWRREPQAATARLSAHLKAPPSSLSLEGIVLYNAAENIKLWQEKKLADLTNFYAASLAKRGTVIPETNADQILDDRILKQLTHER